MFPNPTWGGIYSGIAVRENNRDWLGTQSIGIAVGGWGGGMQMGVGGIGDLDGTPLIGALHF